MKTAVLLLNFGEPEEATLEQVVPFLERIFLANAPLMGNADPAAVTARSRKMAEDRAPGLIEEYRAIGGSPLARQAQAQARALEAELRARGCDVAALVGMQFTEPSIARAVAQAREMGAQRIVALPVYPLAGPSTTATALAEVDRAAADAGWAVEIVRIPGWHSRPEYVAVRAAAVRQTLDAAGLSLDDPGTRLVFSAHGTPLKYVEQGSRYVEYVEEFCAALASALGAPRYELGYQNHSNRPGLAWTQPETEAVIEATDARRVVVEAVSFMHEQSETLAELDRELREHAEARGLEFHRVPIPFDAPAFIAMLADLAEPFTAARPSPDPAGLAPCRCFPGAGTFCANAALAAAHV
jgi:protoporphyrin/coproporphyrin ferrochelatase